MIIRTPNPFAEVLAQAAGIRRLLIVGASPTTRHHPAPMPALQRYEGSDYRFLRRMRSEFPDTQILILSAEYGLVRPDQPIRDDGRRMSRERAGELAPRISQYLAGWFQVTPTCGAVCVNVTCSAHAALPGFDDWCLRRQVAYTALSGSTRQRLHQMCSWLLGSTPAARIAAETITQPASMEVHCV